MLALLSTLVFAAAATFALGAGFVTVRGRQGQIASLLADYRSIQRDREFLVHVTSYERDTPRAVVASQLRRISRRAVIRAEAARAEHLQRAVA